MICYRSLLAMLIVSGILAYTMTLHMRHIEAKRHHQDTSTLAISRP